LSRTNISISELSAPAAVAWYRRRWVRRAHALFGVVSALNLFVLICTGLLLQHASLLRLDEKAVSRRLLPSSYRPQDGDSGVRADIVVTDIHSGRILGVAGALILDGVTLLWLAMLATGLLMYFRRRAHPPSAAGRDTGQELEDDEEEEDEEVGSRT
jgi:hypothetical protein